MLRRRAASGWLTIAALAGACDAHAQHWLPRHGRTAIAPSPIRPPQPSVRATPKLTTAPVAPGSKVDQGSLPAVAPLPPPRPADLAPTSVEPSPQTPAVASPQTPAAASPQTPAAKPTERAPPSDGPRPSATPAQAPPSPARPAVEEPSACAARLAGLDIEAVPTATSAKPADPVCAVATPVDVLSIGGKSLSTPVKLVGRPELDCPTAQVFGRFVHEIAAPLAKGTMGTALTAIVAGGYQCRPFNHLPGGHVSGHATGIALDIMGFAFADGRRFEVGQKTDAATETFLAGLRHAACGYFTTVLGPGSNAAHANHLHIDTMHHGVGSDDHYRICE